MDKWLPIENFMIIMGMSIVIIILMKNILEYFKIIVDLLLKLHFLLFSIIINIKLKQI